MYKSKQIINTITQQQNGTLQVFLWLIIKLLIFFSTINFFLNNDPFLIFLPEGIIYGNVSRNISKYTL